MNKILIWAIPIEHIVEGLEPLHRGAVMKPTGCWTTAQAERFLAASRLPLHLASNGRTGHPLMATLWYLPLDGRIWCATQRTARVAQQLEADPRCAFEVAVDTIPYRGVRGRAVAGLYPERGEAILRSLIDRYLDDADSPLARWLLTRTEHEVAIALEPVSLSSWDFSARMGGA